MILPFMKHAVFDQSMLRAAWRNLITDLREVIRTTLRTTPLLWKIGPALVLVAIPVLLLAAHYLAYFLPAEKAFPTTDPIA